MFENLYPSSFSKVGWCFCQSLLSCGKQGEAHTAWTAESVKDELKIPGLLNVAPSLDFYIVYSQRLKRLALPTVCLEKICNIQFHICCILAMRSSTNGIGRSKEKEWLISASAGSPELYEVVTVKPIQFLPTFANSAFPNGRSLWKIYLPANSVSWRYHPPSYIKSLHGIRYKCK